MLFCKLKRFIPSQHLTLNLPLCHIYLIAALEIPTLSLSCPLWFVHGASYWFLIDQDLVVDVALLHDHVDALLAREESTGGRMMDLRVVLGQFVIDYGEGLPLAAIDQMHIIFYKLRGSLSLWLRLSLPVAHELQSSDGDEEHEEEDSQQDVVEIPDYS